MIYSDTQIFPYLTDGISFQLAFVSFWCLHIAHSLIFDTKWYYRLILGFPSPETRILFLRSSQGIIFFLRCPHSLGPLPHQHLGASRVSSPDWCGSVGWASSQKVKGRGSIPGQSTCLGCRFGPRLGSVPQAADHCVSHWCFSPSLSPSLPLSKKSINQ